MAGSKFVLHQHTSIQLSEMVAVSPGIFSEIQFNKAASVQLEINYIKKAVRLNKATSNRIRLQV